MTAFRCRLGLSEWLVSFFSSKRLLNERQVRYNEILSEFQYVLKWRSGVVSDRLDASSRRDQDKPTDKDDERTAGRIIQLNPSIEALPTTFSTQNREIKDAATTAKILTTKKSEICGNKQ